MTLLIQTQTELPISYLFKNNENKEVKEVKPQKLSEL